MVQDTQKNVFRASEKMDWERHEAKYVVHPEQVLPIREFLRDYCIPDPNGTGPLPEYTVTTLQFDDPMLSLYHAKEEEALNRFKLRVRTYGSERAEVRALARSLRAELLAGRPLSDCYIAVPALDRYLPLLRDALHTYGIPFTVHRGHELDRAPAVSAARQVLRLAVHGVDRDSLRALLASGWLRTWCTVQSSAEELLERGLAACR